MLCVSLSQLLARLCRWAGAWAVPLAFHHERQSQLCVFLLTYTHTTQAERNCWFRFSFLFLSSSSLHTSAVGLGYGRAPLACHH